MPKRSCTIHGPYDESYAICPKCAGAAGDGPTIGPTASGLATDEQTLPPRKRSGQGFDGTTTIPPRGGGGLGVGTIVEGPQETGMLGWLIVKDAPSMRRGHVLPLKPNAIFGRGTIAGGFTVPDDKMSEIHARIQRDETSWKITDTGSTNGTHVNGKKIKETTALQENDEIKMGSSVFVLKVLA